MWVVRVVITVVLCLPGGGGAWTTPILVHTTSVWVLTIHIPVSCAGTLILSFWWNLVKCVVL